MSRALRGGLVVLAVVGLLDGTAGCARKTIYGEGTSRIETSVGQDIVIELPSNPTTGHEWRIGGLPDSRIVALLKSDYEPASSPAPGAAGHQRLTFRAVGPGATTIRLDYGRPWETPPVKSATFTVVVR